MEVFPDPNDKKINKTKKVLDKNNENEYHYY